ncbi:MAG: FMN-binding protein [Cyclobacteriaceae bacterium]|nr:FMN-binding protein [Cyclobacteriaceae bacterium]
MNQEQDNITPQIIKEKEPSSFKLIFALGLAGLISGIILVGTYIYTDPLIKANKEAAMQRAIFKVLPECTSYTALKLEDGKLIEKVANTDKKQETDNEESLIYAGYNANKQLIGFAIPGSEPGFQDIIGAIFGYNATGKVIIGFEVLESKETPGLGDKIFKDADFKTNFISLVVEPEIVAVKKGKKQNPNEVETITGATISSKAIVRLLNKTMAIWQSTINEYIKQNNIPVINKHEQARK